MLENDGKCMNRDSQLPVMAGKGVAVLKLLQGADLKELNRSLKTYLAPLFGNSGYGKEKNAKSDQRTLAKEYVPFLVQLLKVCGAKLASVPSKEDSAAVTMADEVFSAMVLAIDGLNVLRSQLAGSPIEMELQRYGLVRRLMNWKRYDAALSQSQLLFRSLCQLSSIPESKASTVNRATSGKVSKAGADKVKIYADSPSSKYDDSVLCPPRQIDLKPELPAVLVAAVVDLIWCIAESSVDSSSCFQIAARLPEQLEPWISVLDPSTVTKQRDALFKAIYKCTLVMLSDPKKFEAGLVQQFCICTLSLCVSSTQFAQYAKVARKLCSSLSCQGSDWCIKAVEICTGAFDEVLSQNKLQWLWDSSEFSDLVEWFARSCQSNNQIEYGWFQIYTLVDHIRQFLHMVSKGSRLVEEFDNLEGTCAINDQISPGAPAVIMGLYGVGLVLMQADLYKTNPEVMINRSRGDSHELLDVNKLEFLSKDVDYFRKACSLLQGTKEVLKVLQRGQSASVGKLTDNKSLLLEGHPNLGGSGETEMLEVTGRIFVSAARALHYVQKPFTKFVQVIWNVYSGRSSETELPHTHFNSALRNVLQLFYPVIVKGMRCSELSELEREVFRKGLQMASQASLAALRMSLLLQDGVQESFDLVRDMTIDPQLEELWWLMSSTYNMGVQLFNIKQYSLACWPLDLANKAAWAKVRSSCSDVKSVNEMLSEACAKCSALVDAQQRNGEPGKSRVTLIDGLMQWAKVRAEIHPIKLPHALVKSFVKLMCLENHSLTQNKVQKEVYSIYSFIGDMQPPLPAGITGLLLEEEHAVCEAMEDQHPDYCRTVKGQITEYLLDKLYTGAHFAIERSRVLMKKCRDLRLHGVENLPHCIKFISEAVSFLEAGLESRGKSAGDLCQAASLEKQLAVAYSIMGICSYEKNPSCQEFLPNIVLSLNMWRCVLESHRVSGGLFEQDISLTTATSEEESLVLLMYICDLLAIQGYSVLCSEAQEMILKVVTYSKQFSTEEWVKFWMNGQMGHLICTVPFPMEFLSTIRQSFDAAANPQEYWQRYFNLFPGSLLEAHHSVQDICDLRHEASESSRYKEKRLEAVKFIANMVHVRLSDGDKSSHFTLHTAGLYHLTAELAFVKGDTNEAIRCAKEAFRLRSRLFKYVFSGLGKTTSGLSSNATSTESASGKSNILQLRERLGPLATSSWPFSVNVQHCLTHPTQWRILGDYIESLMQMGVIYERMGAVDEAERSFREGHRLAVAQNLPLALASFSMSLGEVHRKRQLWDSAENYLIQAKQVFHNVQPRRFCEACILTGKALLELRIGDLVRHCWCCQSGKRKEHGSRSNIIDHCFENSRIDALSSYKAAAASIYVLLKEDGGKYDRELLSLDENQITMLKSLQRKGKTVSLEIMSHNLEEAGATGPQMRKRRLRKTVQSRSSSLSNSEAGSAGMEKSISALCDDLRLTSLESDPLPQDLSRTSISKPISCKNIRAMLTFEEQVAIASKLDDRSIGRTSSIEEWPACKWTQLGQKLMSRVLLQRGKCYIHLGELDEAAGIFKQAMSILDVSSLAHPDNTDMRRSSFPVEEGALFYHMSRLWLQRGQHGSASRHGRESTRQDPDDLEIGKTQNINQLFLAFSLCHQVPLLLQKIAKLLAILHVPKAWGGPGPIVKSQENFSVQDLAEVAAYFHQASLGTSIRQQHLAILDSKLDDPFVEDNQQINPCLPKACVEKMQTALRVAPVNVTNVRLQARHFWECLPRSSACCISFVSMEDGNILKGNCCLSTEDSDAANDWLLVTRLSTEAKLLVVLLPVAPLLENLPSDVSRSKAGDRSSTPYDLSDDEDKSIIPAEGESRQLPEVLNQKNELTIMQRVAAEFGSVLDESRLSTSGTHPVATMEEKSIWWKWRMELDVRLSMFLTTVENSWFGPFKCLLLGEPQLASMTKSFELCTVYLLEMINFIISQETATPINHIFVKILLQAVGSLTASELERAIADMLGFHDYRFCDTHPNEREADCNICAWKMDEAGKYAHIKNISKSFRAAYKVSTQACENNKLKCLTDENNGKRRSRRQTKGKPGSKNQTPLDNIMQMVTDCSHCQDIPVKRLPLQLILDSDSQALPWESLPFLRDQEVYRMPSLGTLHAVYIQHQYHSISNMLRPTEIKTAEIQKVEGRKVKVVKRSSLPTAKEVDSDEPLDVTYVNPYNTFYILNPNGDLPSTQAAFEDWFTHQPGWKGKAGTVPTAEEYQMGLQNHDLFVYLGHGSGDQFLPERYVRQLDHCAASLLMGCSSGRLSLRGEYQPVGVVLSYLMAGCPTIIANLWDVTDGDIDRFSRSLLHSWLGSNPDSVHSESRKGLRDISDFELAMQEGNSANATFQAQYTSKVNNRLLDRQAIISQADFQDMHRLGSAIGQSRNACRLPHLIGASPVCYGVPTGVWKQDMKEIE